MATLPKHHVTKSHDELRRQYTEDGWEDRLKMHEAEKRCATESEPGRGQTIQKTRYKYWDDQNNVVAVLFRYRRTDGDRLVVRMLREGDTVYSGPSVSGAPPAV